MQAVKSQDWHLLEHEIIKEVTIRHGFIVDGIGFTAVDGGGKTFTKWFGGRGGTEDKIILQRNEHIVRITGTHGDYDHDGSLRHISSLTIVTNLNSNGYGPYPTRAQGTKNTTKFSSPRGILSGFYGSAANVQYLDFISLFVKQDPLLKFGPWGNQSPTNWKMELGDRETIRKITIDHGFIVDAIEFTVGVKNQSPRKSATKVLGNPSGSREEISLKVDEHVLQISGTHGVYEFDGQRHIASITIYTNICKNGYGPFGLEYHVKDICSFSSPSPDEGYDITGFFGRTGQQYLDSIGVYMKKREN